MPREKSRTLFIIFDPLNWICLGRREADFFQRVYPNSCIGIDTPKKS